jgi:hypothetical protein
MTPEEYLRARGWERGELSTGKVFWRKHGQRMPSLAEAVETQLAEDRACLVFVLERSVVAFTDADGCRRVLPACDVELAIAPKR